MQYLDSISLIGVKEINKKIESFFQPSIQFYEYLTYPSDQLHIARKHFI